MCADEATAACLRETQGIWGGGGGQEWEALREKGFTHGALTGIPS